MTLTKQHSAQYSSSELESVARQAAEKASAIIKNYYESGLVARHKGAIDLVTKADEESQKAIVEILQTHFPDHHILAEEGALGHGESLEGPIWVVDPLDGTTNFAHGFPLFAVSIGFRDQGVTKFGLIHVPLLNEWFVAHKGQGARLNGRSISVSSVPSVDQSLLATGFPYDRRNSPVNNLNYFCHFEMAAMCVRRAGAAAVDLAYTACGRFDGFWELKLSPWDVCAGALLVEEAGGKVSEFQGKPLDDLWCGEVLAANPSVHKEMLHDIQAIHKPLLPPFE